MRKLFGTDGIRGRANQHPMTGSMAFKLGQAAAHKFRGKERMKVLIGKDTRRSGYIFEYALTSGLCSMGADVLLVGPMPTPAIAHLVRSFACDMGIMITASHNPAGDNGIKFFDRTGHKLPDDVEEEIENLVEKGIDVSGIKIEDVGRAYRIDDAQGRYIEFVKGSVGNNTLSGLKIVLDCAHGAAYRVAPLIFRELGAEVLVYGNKPDGLNINQESGALYPELIRSAVLGEGADCGIALDGDADRIIMVDEKGELVDGDKIMAICALHMHKKKSLKHDTIVATVMSNMGLEVAMREKGIRLLRTKVGDRYVVEEMQKEGYNLGGEQSGHIILSEHNSTGDGTMTGLHILSILKESGKKLSELASVYDTYPQKLINVKVAKKRPLEKMPKVLLAVEAAKKALGETGRVLVRYSGTENKCRVMAEGSDSKKITKAAESIAAAIRKEIGE